MSSVTNVLKKTRDGTYNPDNDGPEIQGATTTDMHPVVTDVSSDVERAINRTVTAGVPTITNKPIKLLSPTMPIKLTSKGAIQLTSSNVNNTGKTRSTPLHSLGGNNPFFHEKRRWEDSFDTAEKQALPGNIVKAAKDKNGETYVTLQEEEFLKVTISPKENSKVSSKPNSIHDDESQDSDGVESTVSKKPGRKPMPDEEITSDSEQDPKVKRKAQNRAAQRAFRERKERYVKELEARIKQVQDAHFIATAQLVDENQQLRAIIYKLESENCALKGIPIQPYQHLYQAPSSSQNPQAQQHLHLNTDSNAGSGTNYAHIAPLIPNTPASTASNQPLILPAYMPSAANSSTTASPIVHTASPSVNQMLLLANNSFQQYPMSPVVSTDIARPSSSAQHSTPSACTSSSTVVSQTAVKKTHKNNQPLEYTFSISTPASLRHNHGNASSSFSKHQKSEPIKPVPLYPPGMIRQQKQKLSQSHQPQSQQKNEQDTNQQEQLQRAKVDVTNTTSPITAAAAIDKNDSLTTASQEEDINNNSNTGTTTTAPAPASVSSSNSSQHGSPFQQHRTHSSITADDASSVVSDKTASTANTQRKRIQQLELDLFDCHIDTEGQLFCERLKNEVCNDAFDRLLSEPLFDQMGKLNLSISDYPVPIVMRPMSSSTASSSFEHQHAQKNNTTALGSANENDGQNDGQAEQKFANNNDTLVAHNHPLIVDKVDVHNSELHDDHPLQQPEVNDKHYHHQYHLQHKHSHKHSEPNRILIRLLTSQEIWFTLSRHEKFSQYTTNQLCQAVKEFAKCSEYGPVLEVDDLEIILSKLDHGTI